MAWATRVASKNNIKAIKMKYVWSSKPVWEGTRKGYKEKAVIGFSSSFFQKLFTSAQNFCGQTYLEFSGLSMPSKPTYLNLRLVSKADTLQLHQRSAKMTNGRSNTVDAQGIQFPTWSHFLSKLAKYLIITKYNTDNKVNTFWQIVGRELHLMHCCLIVFSSGTLKMHS